MKTDDGATAIAQTLILSDAINTRGSMVNVGIARQLILDES